MACILADESDSTHKEACGTQDNSLSESEDCSSFTLDILHVGDVFDYTVPVVTVITVKLQHVVVSVPEAERGETKQYDVFLKHSQGLQWRVPCCIKVLESCYVEMSEFMKSPYVHKYKRLHSEGALFVWKWELLAFDGDSGSNNSSINEPDSSDNESDPEQTSSCDSHESTHTLTFKCIGTTKSAHYQSALRRARDLLLRGQPVPISVVHEPTNPRDAKALAFVCELDGKEHRIGYIVSEVLDEVHDAYRAGIIVSVKLAWVRYITEWTRSGPGFFAGVDIEKKGRWSGVAISRSSTK